MTSTTRVDLCLFLTVMCTSARDEQGTCFSSPYIPKQFLEELEEQFLKKVLIHESIAKYLYVFV